MTTIHKELLKEIRKADKSGNLAPLLAQVVTEGEAARILLRLSIYTYKKAGYSYTEIQSMTGASSKTIASITLQPR